jgi:hypothetical protein
MQVKAVEADVDEDVDDSPEGQKQPWLV